MLKSLRLLFLIVFPFVTACAQTQDWRTASKESAGLAPLPKEHSAALVHVYAARAYNWRGNFAVHCWMATKEKDAAEYMTYHVIGWRARSDLGVVREENDIPDRRWFGAMPELIFSASGEKAENMIPLIKEAAKKYPYPNEYRAWPGPNSNTFISHIMRSVPGFGVELPPNAIGKDWIHDADVVGLTETRSGFQFSILGALGFTLGVSEGIELNLLGLTFGIDFLRPAIKLPLIGRVGMADSPVFD